MLDSLNFKAKAGDRIGVIGREGAGKSTLGLSFSRMVEIIEGQILVDTVDVKTVDVDHLRRSVTVIPREPTIFSGSLRFNLDPEGVVSDGRLLDLLRAAGLDVLLRRDSRGL